MLQQPQRMYPFMKNAEIREAGRKCKTTPFVSSPAVFFSHNKSAFESVTVKKLIVTL